MNMEYNVVRKKTNRFNMTLTVAIIAGAAAGVGGAAAAIYTAVLCCPRPRQAQAAPRRAPEVEVAQIPNGNALEVVNGVHERLPAGEGEVILFEGAERVLNVERILNAERMRSLGPPLSPFEPPLMNPTDFLVSAILIFFVFSLLIYVVIRAAKTLLCTNHFVRIH